MADIPLPRSGPEGRRSFDDLIRWMLVVALTLLGAVMLWDYGYLQFVLENDITFISQAILIAFAAATLYVLWHLLALSRELAAAETIAARIEAGAAGRAAVADAGETRVAACVADILTARAAGAPGSAEALLAATTNALRGPVRMANYMGDALYRLGMLGAVVGFIMMLASVRDLGAFDPESLRGALQEMTGGMAVSLLTTIAGLATGMLLKIQTNILESLTLRIARQMVRITGVLIPARAGGAG